MHIQSTKDLTCTRVHYCFFVVRHVGTSTARQARHYTRDTHDTLYVSCRDVTSQVVFGLIHTTADTGKFPTSAKKNKYYRPQFLQQTFSRGQSFGLRPNGRIYVRKESLTTKFWDTNVRKRPGFWDIRPNFRKADVKMYIGCDGLVIQVK